MDFGSGAAKAWRIPDAVTRPFISNLRARGTPVTFIPIEGGDRGITAIETARPEVQWISRRFDGATRAAPGPR